MEFLPPYAPELNPVEVPVGTGSSMRCPTSVQRTSLELCAFAHAKLKRTPRRKLLVAAFWKQADLPF